MDAIAVSVENSAGISTVLRKAREHGIKVLTWDADAAPDARDFFINQATPEGIANTLTDEAARLLSAKGEFAIVTGALSAANQNLWIDFIKKRLAKYPEMKLVTIRPSLMTIATKRFRRRQTVPQGVSEGPADHGHRGAGGARVGGGREAIRPQECGRDWPVAAESVQALRARRKRAGRRVVEYAGLGLPDGIHSGNVDTESTGERGDDVSGGALGRDRDSRRPGNFGEADDLQ